MKIIKPNKDFSSDQIRELIEGQKTELKQELLSEGALLFRGFNILHAEDFEALAKIFSPNLSTEYYGTSPRTKIGGTKAVFTASEVPGFFPMIQHCELSFLNKNPDHLFFFCHTPPKVGGETPICDVRKIANQMDPRIRSEFENKKLMTIRNYHKQKRFLSNPFELKPWKEMFGSANKSEIEKICDINGLEVKWLANEKLQLISHNEPVKLHPQTGERIWHNHALVFHKVTTNYESLRVYKRQKNIRNLFTCIISHVLVWINKQQNRDTAPMDVRFGDGTAIPDLYIKHIHDLIWKNQVIFQWQKGDFLLIDNKSTSHGRLPFSGKRNILVAWQ